MEDSQKCLHFKSEGQSRKVAFHSSLLTPYKVLLRPAHFCNEIFFIFVAGEGSFSTVYLAESKAQKGGWVAIKVVEKRNLLKTKRIPTPDDDGWEKSDDEEEDMKSPSVIEQDYREIMRLIDKEIRIMSALDHPHVTHLEEVYEDDRRVCFVMELAKGGEVFDRLVQKVSPSR